MTTLHTLLFPDTQRRLPGARWWSIAARTVHLAATGTLLGGHVFGAPAGNLLPVLWTAIASAAIMIALELYGSAHWLHQVGAIFVYAKLALLCLILVAWDSRVPILFVVVALGSIGSHAPRRVRHYSVLYRRIMTD